MTKKCADCFNWDDRKSFRFDFAKAMPCAQSVYGYASSDQSICEGFKPKAIRGACLDSCCPARALNASSRGRATSLKTCPRPTELP